MTYDDLPHLMRWGSDPDFRHYQWAQKAGVFAEKNARAWIERMSRPGESACWVIEQEGRPIGFANYRDFHPKGKSAEIGIGIGEPDLWPLRATRLAENRNVFYDVVEVLLDLVACPRYGHIHSYAGCGWHYSEFSRQSGRRRRSSPSPRRCSD